MPSPKAGECRHVRLSNISTLEIVRNPAGDGAHILQHPILHLESANQIQQPNKFNRNRISSTNPHRLRQQPRPNPASHRTPTNPTFPSRPLLHLPDYFGSKFLLAYTFVCQSTTSQAVDEVPNSRVVGVLRQCRWADIVMEIGSFDGAGHECESTRVRTPRGASSWRQVSLPMIRAPLEALYIPRNHISWLVTFSLWIW
jgi:hypothetical protein